MRTSASLLVLLSLIAHRLRLGIGDSTTLAVVSVTDEEAKQCLYESPASKAAM